MSNSGTKTMPIPRPPTISGASRSRLPTATAALERAVRARQANGLDRQPCLQHPPPSFCITALLIPEPMNAPAAHGAVVIAECQGEKPSPVCKNTLKIKTIPPIEATNTSEHRTPNRVRASA